MENNYLKGGIATIIIIIIIMVAYAFYLNVVSNQHVQKMTQAQYASVNGAKVLYRDIHPSLLGNNIAFKAAWMEDIQSQLEGTIKKVFVENGAYVKVGDVIAEIENIDLPTQIAQVNGMISQAEAKVLNAQQEVDRCNILLAQGAASQKQYDDATASLMIAKGEKETVDAQRQQVLLKQSKNLIVAPRDGELLNLYFKQGYFIRVGESICLIGDFSKLTFSLMLEDELAENFQGIDDFYIPVSAEMLKDKAYQNQKNKVQGYEPVIKAKLTAVIPPFSVQSAVRTFNWSIIEQSDMIEPTTYTNIDIIAEKSERVLTIPLSAIISENNQVNSAVVFVVTENNTLMERRVVLGRKDARFVEIISGLKEKEIVIVSGKHGLKIGQTVRVKLTEGSESS